MILAINPNGRTWRQEPRKAWREYRLTAAHVLVLRKVEIAPLSSLSLGSEVTSKWKPVLETGCVA